MKKKKTLKELIERPAQLARDLGVSYTTVTNWIENNAIPPRRIVAVAASLGMEISELHEFAKPTTKPVHLTKKSEGDLEVYMAAYEGRPYETHLPERSIRVVLARWGDRLPLMYNALKSLQAKEITAREAAASLGITYSALMNLRARYGLAPGPRKGKERPQGPYKMLAKKAGKLAIDVIAGRKTAKAAAIDGNVPQRTLHRHIADVLRPQFLNEISHWSTNFRMALAWEIEKDQPRRSVEWRQWADVRNLVLPKRPKWPKSPQDWRTASLRRMLIAVLTDEMSLEGLAAARGGESSVLKGLFDAELSQMAMKPFQLSEHHQAAAEIVLAREGHFRTLWSGS